MEATELVKKTRAPRAKKAKEVLIIEEEIKSQAANMGKSTVAE